MRLVEVVDELRVDGRLEVTDAASVGHLARDVHLLHVSLQESVLLIFLLANQADQILDDSAVLPANSHLPEKKTGLNDTTQKLERVISSP